MPQFVMNISLMQRGGGEGVEPVESERTRSGVDLLRFKDIGRGSF